MYNSIATRSAAAPSRYPQSADLASAEPLTEQHKQEALDYLSRRPFNTVILAGWIRDHGIVSPKHRGIFYGYRDAKGELTGVALIGRNLLFEASTDEAVAAFARCARDHSDIRMVFAEEERLVRFWQGFRGEMAMPAMSRHRLISSGGTIAEDVELVDELRVATRDELDQIVSAHAEMVFTETGVDPLEADADGFRLRCAERVDRGWVWVWMKGDQLIFKTDIVSVTPEAIYMEGLWVAPNARGNRYSTRCMATLSRKGALNPNASGLEDLHTLLQPFQTRQESASATR